MLHCQPTPALQPGLQDSLALQITFATLPVMLTQHLYLAFSSCLQTCCLVLAAVMQHCLLQTSCAALMYARTRRTC